MFPIFSPHDRISSKLFGYFYLFPEIIQYPLWPFSRNFSFYSFHFAENFIFYQSYFYQSKQTLKSCRHYFSQNCHPVSVLIMPLFEIIFIFIFFFPRYRKSFLNCSKHVNIYIHLNSIRYSL